MDWGSDELGHRSAERSGWAAELREADPAAVDDSVTGAVAFAAATDDAGAEAADASIDATSTPTYTCGFCRGEVPESEALDAEGFPIGAFEWVADPAVGEREAYHRECVDAGEGRFLPWGASGVLGEE